MDFIDEIRAFAKNIPAIAEKVSTEEGTKNALVMPFIRILGYDVFNPNEVNPEFTADVGTKKGEKVDYAIMKDGQPVILVECKPVNADLAKEHASQLFRYFSTTSSKVGILTNGVLYQFFTDLDQKNKMDNKPFLEINLLDIKEPLIQELKKFSKQGLILDELDGQAEQLKYTREIINILDKQFSKPDEEFISFFAKQVYSKKLTQQAKEKFTSITQDALNQFLNDKINSRLKSAMEGSKPQPVLETAQAAEGESEDGIVTTPDEWEAVHIIKAILSEKTDPARVTIRDAKSYCAILLDDNNRKPISRLYFNTKQYYVSVFDGKTENKIPIANLNEMFKLSNQFKFAVSMYEEKAPNKPIEKAPEKTP